MIGYFVHLISIVIYIIEIMVLVRGIVCLKMNKLPRGMYVVKNIINYYTAVITIFVIVDCVYYMLSENFNGILIPVKDELALFINSISTQKNKNYSKIDLKPNI